MKAALLMRNRRREKLKPGAVDPVTGVILSEQRSFNYVVPNGPSAADVYRALAPWKPLKGLERKTGDRGRACARAG